MLKAFKINWVHFNANIKKCYLRMLMQMADSLTFMSHLLYTLNEGAINISVVSFYFYFFKYLFNSKA